MLTNFQNYFTSKIQHTQSKFEKVIVKDPTTSEMLYYTTSLNIIVSF